MPPQEVTVITRKQICLQRIVKIKRVIRIPYSRQRIIIFLSSLLSLRSLQQHPGSSRKIKQVQK